VSFRGSKYTNKQLAKMSHFQTYWCSGDGFLRSFLVYFYMNSEINSFVLLSLWRDILFILDFFHFIFPLDNFFHCDLSTMTSISNTTPSAPSLTNTWNGRVMALDEASNAVSLMFVTLLLIDEYNVETYLFYLRISLVSDLCTRHQSN